MPAVFLGFGGLTVKKFKGIRDFEKMELIDTQTTMLAFKMFFLRIQPGY